MLDAVLPYALQSAVASETAGERQGERNEIEPAQHLDKLSSGLRLADEIPPRDRTVLERADIAREQRAILGARDRDQRPVVTVIAVFRVEACEPKVRRDPAKMDVGDKAGFDLQSRADTIDIAEIDRTERRIRGHTVVVANKIREVHGPPVDDKAIDLRVGHAKRLDEILD